MSASERFPNATPRPWSVERQDAPALAARFTAWITNRSGAVMSPPPNPADAALIVYAVNLLDPLEAVAEAASHLARLPYPVSSDERGDWLVYQAKLRDALAALDRARKEQEQA